MMHYGDYDGVGWMLGGGLMLLLFWLGPVALVVWGLGSRRGGRRPTTHEETPREILRRRYASGEIDEEEFERARRTLA
jgi:putative membrane protein